MKAGNLRAITLLLLVFVSLSAFSQKKKKRISHSSEESIYEKIGDTDVIKLYRNVKFKHEGAIMTCDSAYYYRKENSFDAYSNVRVNQGDTVSMTCNTLHYDGTSKILDAKGDVHFRDKKMTLLTPSITYNRENGTAVYTQGGDITDPENTLHSRLGIYNTTTEWFIFKDSVRLKSAKYSIEADTLFYNSSSGVARFRGPSRIESDSGYIKCNYGDYDTQNDIAYFSNRCEIHDRASVLIGDSVYYHRNAGIGDLYGDVYLADTIQRYTITGQHAYFQEDPEYALVTGDPLYTMVDDSGDSLHIHGDTLRINTGQEQKRLIRVYFNSKFYKSDFQGKCDSLVFDESDSTLRMFENPVLWNGESQLTANDIYMTLRNGNLDSIFMIKNAFILSKVDSIKYDQVRGKDMKGKFVNSELRSLYVLGNGQTVYTVMEDDKQQGVNRADCSDIIVRLKNADISEVVFLTKPNAKMYPLKDIPQGELFLRGFNPRLDEKPNSKADLFLD
jgi:lipopolysaccharide assembly outer membrane protein LptD (OstA)